MGLEVLCCKVMVHSCMKEVEGRLQQETQAADDQQSQQHEEQLQATEENAHTNIKSPLERESHTHMHMRHPMESDAA